MSKQVSINLNDKVSVTLRDRGRLIWRAHVETTRACLGQYDRFTGDEEVALQFWEFIHIFGSENCWNIGTPPVVNMNVMVRTDNEQPI